MAKKTIEQAVIEAEIQDIAINETLDFELKVAETTELAEKAKTQEERENLIAEASRMAGLVEAFGVISKFADVSNLLQLKKMKEKKIYKDMPGIGTWENFCISVGISSKKIDEDLRNLNTFGSEFLLTVSNYDIGYRELRQLKKVATSGSFAIDADSVIIEGETIPLTDKDELKDALERIIATKDKEIDNHVKNKERLIKEKQQAYDEADNNKRLLNQTKAELDKYKTATVNGISADDRPSYNSIKACEDKLSIVHKNLLEIAQHQLSEFNQQVLGGVIMMMFQVAEDIRLTVNAKGGTYFDRLYLTDEELAACNNMVTPSKLNTPTED